MRNRPPIYEELQKAAVDRAVAAERQACAQIAQAKQMICETNAGLAEGRGNYEAATELTHMANAAREILMAIRARANQDTKE